MHVKHLCSHVPGNTEGAAKMASVSTTLYGDLNVTVYFNSGGADVSTFVTLVHGTVNADGSTNAGSIL